MTNLEKFEEVFGITIDDRFLRDRSSSQCRMIDTIKTSFESFMKDKCVEYNSCHECPLFKFWEKEYVEKEEKDESNY